MIKYPTTTALEIIRELEKNSVILKPEDKTMIIEKVFDAIVDAAQYESNGCDCGQPSCRNGCA